PVAVRPKSRAATPPARAACSTPPARRAMTASRRLLPAPSLRSTDAARATPWPLRRHCERSEAIQSQLHRGLDCFVATLLAMTGEEAGHPPPQPSPARGEGAERCKPRGSNITDIIRSA